MTRVFACCRVSTADQTTDNQVQEIAGAGFQITSQQRTITATVSGSFPANERKGFKMLLDKLEAGHGGVAGGNGRAGALLGLGTR